MRPIRIAVYADVNCNVVDGSAIWLASLTHVLCRVPGARVTVLRKAPVRRDVITGELSALPDVRISGPDHGRALTPLRALDELERLDRAAPFDLVVLRGRALARAAADRPRLAGRLWTYLTDIEQDAGAVTAAHRAELATIVAASDRLLCQTEQLRGHLEALAPGAAGATVLLPPMVAPAFTAVGDARDAAARDRAGRDAAARDREARDAAARDRDARDAVARDRPPRDGVPDHVRRLCYAGKFAPAWGVLEMIDAFARLRRHDPTLELHVAGDKVHDPPEDPSYAPAIRRALTTTPGLVWHGAVPRARVAALLADADIALAGRTRALDGSLELSTKLLEYGAAGAAPVCNRTPMHVDLLGDDYPLFLDDLHDVERVLSEAVGDPSRWRRARAAARAASSAFTYDRVAADLAPHLRRSVPDVTPPAGRPPRVLVAAHDGKFFSAIAEHLSRTGLPVAFDDWSGHARHDEPASRRLLADADVVICEWALGNAVWYSHHVRRDQRLIVRLHRMELDTAFPGQIAIERVARVVVVSAGFRDKLVDGLGWPADRIDVVGNWVDTLALDRPKLPAARHTLGLLGWLPRRKRVDRALDVVERLAAGDGRWRLRLAGPLPWELAWVWARPSERAYFAAQLDRIRSSPLLRRAVSIDGMQHNVAAWLRGVGWVLSPSEDESFHLAPAEGMASGAVPVLWPWEAASKVYGRRWLCRDTADAVARIAATDWDAERRHARRYVRATYPLEPVVTAWSDLVTGRERVAA